MCDSPALTWWRSTRATRPLSAGTNAPARWPQLEALRDWRLPEGRGRYKITMQPLVTDRGIVTGSFSHAGRHLPYARNPNHCCTSVNPRAPQASDGGPCEGFSPQSDIDPNFDFDGAWPAPIDGRSFSNSGGGR